MIGTASKPKRPTFYMNKREVWDAAKCARMARRIAKDGLGTPYPFRGAYPRYPHGWGRIRYNGGCIRPDTGPKRKWYDGEVFPLPKLAKGWKWVHVPTWCPRIVPSSHKT